MLKTLKKHTSNFSRKYIVSLLSLGLLSGGFLVSHYFGDISTLYSTFVYGILGIAGLYKVSNVMDGWVDNKHGPKGEPPP
jgi:uncharacterized membrane protein YuzA (DUF378 family)